MSTPLLLLLLLAAALPAATTATRILFVGNSFTFVNDLPHQIKSIAASLGDANVTVANSTIGGCTLYEQSPSRDARTKALLAQDWDFIVLQDYSALPTVRAARDQYLAPAVGEFAAQKKRAKIVMYLTWGYIAGTPGACPSSDTGKCFPLGTLANLTAPACATDGHYQSLTGSFECMGYSLARGYLGPATKGADLVVPCGLAWQVVRGSRAIPAGCKALADAQYSAPFPLDVPFQVEGGALDGFLLYRKLKHGVIDKHPNVAGQYLNALTFYAALFGKSPVGAAPPLNTGSKSAGDRPLKAAELKALQLAAAGTVKACGKACGL